MRNPFTHMQTQKKTQRCSKTVLESLSCCFKYVSNYQYPRVSCFISFFKFPPHPHQATESKDMKMLRVLMASCQRRLKSQKKTERYWISSNVLTMLLSNPNLNFIVSLPHLSPYFWMYMFLSPLQHLSNKTILFNMTPSPPGCAKRRCTSPLRVPSSPAWSPFRWLRHDAAGCCHGVGQHLRHGGR